MHLPISSPPELATQPPPPVVVPEVLREVPRQPRGPNVFVILLGIAAVAGLAWFLWSRQSAAQPRAQSGKGTAPVSVRTATVRTGDISQTLRLTGTTGAERFASLLVPQLRGSRGDGLREGKTFQTPGANYTVPSNANRSTRSQGTGSSVQTSQGSSGASETQVASTSGQATGGGSSALRSATSRVGGRQSGSTPRASSAPNAPSAPDDGLGSTSSSLIGSGTGGGGGGTGGSGGRSSGGIGDYSMVLQTAARAGVTVKKGTQVAEFDRESMMTRLDDYRAAVAQMDASFQKLKAEVEVQRRAHSQSIDNAKADLDQARLDVKTVPVLGEIDAERVKLAAEEAEAKYKQLLAEVKFVDVGYNSQVKTAELELQQAYLELKRAEANADRMLMKAPIDGLVVMQTTFRGTEFAQIQAGDQLWAGMRFMQIVDTSSMVINAAVNQVDADTVRVGSKASIRFDAFPDLQLPATVEAIGAMTKPGGMRAAYVKEIPVVLRLTKLDPRVIPDLTVSVDVEIATDKQATIAPVSSIFRDEAGSGTSYVFVRNGDVWERRPVEVGLVSNLYASIRSGLRPGEIVASERPPEDQEGQRKS